ncbi:hypothetical protein BsWGS_26470 [Bradybaena similaris]
MSIYAFLAVLLCALVCCSAYRPSRFGSHRGPPARHAPPPSFDQQQHYDFQHHHHHHHNVSDAPAGNVTGEPFPVNPVSTPAVVVDESTTAAPVDVSTTA